MGFSHSTYFAYGIHIPTNRPAGYEADHTEDTLPTVKATCPDVGYLQAGDYDREMFFLVTHCEEIDLGKFEHVTPDRITAEQRADWDRQLAAAAQSLGYDNASAPGWLAIPDMS